MHASGADPACGLFALVEHEVHAVERNTQSREEIEYIVAGDLWAREVGERRGMWWRWREGEGGGVVGGGRPCMVSLASSGRCPSREQPSEPSRRHTPAEPKIVQGSTGTVRGPGFIRRSPQSRPASRKAHTRRGGPPRWVAAHIISRLGRDYLRSRRRGGCEETIAHPASSTTPTPHSHPG